MSRAARDANRGPVGHLGAQRLTPLMVPPPRPVSLPNQHLTTLPNASPNKTSSLAPITQAPAVSQGPESG